MKKCEIVEDSSILPDTAARVVTGAPIDQAIRWRGDQVRRAVEGKAG